MTQWTVHQIACPHVPECLAYKGTAEWAKCLEACAVKLLPATISHSKPTIAIPSKPKRSSKEIVFAVPYDYTYNN